MNIREVLKRQALNNGKSFNIERRRYRSIHIDQTLTHKYEDTTTATAANEENVLCDDGGDHAINFTNFARDQCGFRRSFEKKIPLECCVTIDQRAVVSLALVRRQSTILGAYANKLPIMALNVSRLLYTIEAFSYRDYNANNHTPIQQALDFYVKTDIAHRDYTLPPNQQFSEFLHCLRTTGYLEYIFTLARELNLNVDLIMGSNVVVRYIRIDESHADQPSIGIGFLTVLHEKNGSKWYVKTTKEPIVTDRKANAQAMIDADPILSLIQSTQYAMPMHEHDTLAVAESHPNISDARDFVKNL